MNRKQCKGCDVQFVSLRSDALTCSRRCRKRYQRICEAITKRMRQMEADKKNTPNPIIIHEDKP